MTSPFRCSVAAAVRHDSMIATAPPAQRWLLIEQEGAWPTIAVDALPADVRVPLAARAAALSARVSLIRRPGRHPRRQGPIQWAFANVAQSSEGIRWSTADSATDVLSADWEVDAGEGEPVAIVCSHSRHDVCCAIRGRPVAKALASLWRGRVWECSHLGGDRFAATMVILPDALCYGRVDPANGPSVLRAHDLGCVVGEQLRGRCSYTRIEQAAQALVRAEGLGSNSIEALRPLGVTALSADVYEVDLEPGWTVRLRERSVSLGSPATCRSVREADGREYELIALS